MPTNKNNSGEVPCFALRPSLFMNMLVLSILMFLRGKFFLVEFFLVDGSPAVEDVGEDEGDEEAHDSHGVECELA